MTWHGELRIIASAQALVGVNRLLDPKNLVQIFVSPRARAKRTLELLGLPASIPVEETEDLAEWDYGDYEGKKTKEIKEENGDWDIWTDGCPGGESPQEVSDRVDRLIERIREFHRQAEQENRKADLLCVAHAHVLRSFTARWINAPIKYGHFLLYDAGGIGCLSYEHDNIDEPAIKVWNVTDGLTGPLIP